MFCRLLPAIAILASLTGCAGGMGPCARTVCPGPDGCGRVSPRQIEGSVAVDRRAPEESLDTLPMSPVPRSHPKVGRLRGHGSLSIGTATRGFVVHGSHLPLEGAHHRILETQAARGLNCGTDDLVDGVLGAAKRVARDHPGAILTVGNIGRCGGGDIPWRVSHNSGRDIDLGFYLLGPDGEQYIPANLIPVNGNGIAMDNDVALRFDTSRNWKMIRALLTDQTLSVQWVFVASNLRERLLQHAQSMGEPAGLVARAAEVMAQPSRRFPHNDHFHVRIYCPQDDLFEGCRDSGSNRSWYHGDGGRATKRVAELTRLSRSPKPEVRAAAATVLGRMGQASVGPRLVRMLSDPNGRVAMNAAKGLSELGIRGVRAEVVRQIATHPDDEVAAVLFDALGTLPARLRTQAMVELLSVQRSLVRDLEVFRIVETARVRALDRLCLAKPTLAAPQLIKALGRPGIDVASIDARLRKLTGFEPDELAALDPIEVWKTWLSRQAAPL